MNDLLSDLLTMDECAFIVDIYRRVPDWQPGRVSAGDLAWWETEGRGKLGAIYAKILDALRKRKPDLRGEIEKYQHLAGSASPAGQCFGVDLELLEFAEIACDPR